MVLMKLGSCHSEAYSPKNLMRSFGVPQDDMQKEIGAHISAALSMSP